MPTYTSITGRLSLPQSQILNVNLDPTINATTAPVSTIAMFNNGGVGALYLKTGSGDTAWTQVTAGAVTGSGTTNYVTYWSGTSALTAEQYLAVSRGGLGASFASSTGFLQFTSGTASVAALTSGQVTTALGYVPFNEAGDTLTGTGGAGYYGYNTQSSAPSAPAAGFRAYSNASSQPSWIANSTSGGSFVSSLNINALSANRTYTLPDTTGTFALGTGAATQLAYWTGTNTVASGSGSVTHGGTLGVTGLITATGGVDNPSGTLAVGANATTLNLGQSSATNTINIGSGSGTTTVNIGTSTSVVNILGSLNYIQSTTLEVANPTLVLNEAGAAGSATASGVTINEGGTTGSPIITASFLTSNARASWDLKAPASSGTMRFTPPTSAFAAEMKTTANSAARTYMFPDATGTVALLTTTTLQQDYLNSTSPQITLNSTQGGLLVKDASTPIAASLFSVQSNGGTVFLDVAASSVGIGVAAGTNALHVRGDILQDNSAGVYAHTVQASVTTTDATSTALITEATISNACYYVRARVLQRRTGGVSGSANDTNIFERWAMFKNNSGTLSLLNNSTPDTYQDVSTTSATWAVSGTNMVLNVVGAATTNYTHFATYEVYRIS